MPATLKITTCTDRVDLEEDYTRYLLKRLFSVLYSVLYSPGKWGCLLPRIILGFNTRSILLRLVQHPTSQGGRHQHTAAARAAPCANWPYAWAMPSRARACRAGRGSSCRPPGPPPSGNRHSPHSGMHAVPSTAPAPPAPLSKGTSTRGQPRSRMRTHRPCGSPGLGCQPQPPGRWPTPGTSPTWTKATTTPGVLGVLDLRGSSAKRHVSVVHGNRGAMLSHEQQA